MYMSVDVIDNIHGDIQDKLTEPRLYRERVSKRKTRCSFCYWFYASAPGAILRRGVIGLITN